MRDRGDFLKNQIFIYSFETKSLFTDAEKAISDGIDRLASEKTKLKKELALIGEAMQETITRQKFETAYRALYGLRKTEDVVLDYQHRLVEIGERRKVINKEMPLLKASLRASFEQNAHIREIRNDAVIDSNVISVFESTLTRTLGLKTNGLYKDIMIIRAFYYDVLRDIMLNGCLWEGEKYLCLTASAGQIRTKKVVFIKESVWNAYSPVIMCGLSLEEINSRGGVNCNKYLAYLALANSATNWWRKFNIHKTIVVEDFEAPVRGMVDYIDDKTYIIQRQEMDVPIIHTDGCGMMLPHVKNRNIMIRLPWIKGLLAVFPFDTFIREANERNPASNHGIVRDIYGVEHDLLAEGIEIIFTKSQFKMWKYYDSWEDYQEKFTTLGCMAGTCNEEEDYIPDAKMNYQMLQTLTDMTVDELSRLANKTNEKIANIASSRETMLNVFGVHPSSREMNSFQKCLQYYPELLSDEYTRNTLRQIKKRLVKNARAGKLCVKGKYLYLIPDLYAYCEWLFLGEEHPRGQLQNGEVYCMLYRDAEKLDCLRSPHLYMEHVIRQNVIDAEKKKWFSPRAIYTSCHDLISKVLQNDWDGDKSLVVADELLVSIAERNAKEVVPLYYSMAKASAAPLDNHRIYAGMIAAYTGGKIGQVSNNITKIWNSDEINIEAIKLLCMENNFVIDYAKTLYKPMRPAHVNAMIASYTRKKTPHFFIYAKDKDEGACERKNNSVVNMLEDVIVNKRLSFTAQDIGMLDYHCMMQNKSRQVDPEVIARFYEMSGSMYRQISVSVNYSETDFGYLRIKILTELAILAGSVEAACDMLIKELFARKTVAHKSTFWFCFGDTVLQNLMTHVGHDIAPCAKCGKRFRKTAPNQRICDACATYRPVGTRVGICVMCGSTFTVSATNLKKVRCDPCQRAHRQSYKANYEQNRRKHKGIA